MAETTAGLFNATDSKLIRVIVTWKWDFSPANTSYEHTLARLKSHFQLALNSPACHS